MGEQDDDSMFIDPEILKKELVISLPILSHSDVEMILNGADSSSEDLSSLDEGENEKPCLKRDQRRLNLLNDPNYVSRRFIDFHLALLKKVSSGKVVERNQFVSSMAKFVYRFNRDDGAHLEECGYPKARIETKVRILKNLLEKQFDRNQTLKTGVANKSADEIRSKPFGRDRFGASYWLFMDTDCFIRLFRENTDTNRTWVNVAKNQQELENLIKVLITDYIVRKKFPEWKHAYQSFNFLSSSHEFEERYSSNLSDIKKGNEVTGESSPLSVQYRSDFIKAGHIDLDPIVNLDRDLSSSPPLSSPTRNNIKIKNILASSSDQDSINSVIINGNRLISSSSSDTRDEVYSPGFSQDLNANQNKNEDFMKIINIAPKIDDNDVQVIVTKPSSEQGIKRKLVDYDDSESGMEDDEKNEETSQDLHQTPVINVPKPNEDLPIALRRSRRGNRTRLAEMSPDSSSTSQSLSQTSSKKKFSDRKWKSPSQFSKTNGRRQRRRRGKSSINGFSSTTSDDRQPTDDSLSEDYFPDNPDILNGGLLEEEDDDDDDYSPRRTAKTVAQCHEKFEIAYKPCSICSQTDRPELLLLCEDCNDAYHLECVKPELLSIPDDDWYCPLCEHKRLCDNLIEKLLILIKDEGQFEMKRRLYVSKRRKRLTNVTVNLDRYVKEPEIKRHASRFISSDEAPSEKKTNSTNEDDDDDSVYGRKKNDENRKPSDPEDKEAEQKGKRRVRSCRRKLQNYSLDDYDKKLKDAMIDAGVHKALVEADSDDSDEIIFKRKSAKKRARYEEDDDFDASDGKSDGDFVPSRRRIVNDNTGNDDNRNIANDNDDTDTYEYDDNFDNNNNDGNDDIGMSDDDNAWRNRRQSSTSSIMKKKPAPKPKRNNQRKSTIRSDDDSTISGNTLSSLTSAIKVKSEPTIPSDTKEFDRNGVNVNGIVKNALTNNENIKYTFNQNQVGIGNETKQRPKRAAVVKKKPVIQQAVVSDEEDKDRPPPPRRIRAKKRYGSHDSSLDEDDDYEKSVHKRRLFNHGRNITRTSITTHIKKLVGDEEVDGEGEGENEEDPTKEKSSEVDETKKDNNNNTKQKNKNSEYEELQISDDDDFPDEEEILKTTGLINLKKPVPAPKAAAVRAPFMPPMLSYHYAMADPTANFDFTCQPETPITEPSDPNQAKGDNNPPTTS